MLILCLEKKHLKAKLIDGKKLSKEICIEVATGVTDIKVNYGVVPGLAVVLVGDDPASAVYVRNKHRAATEAGMLVEDFLLPGTISQTILLENLNKVAVDKRFHGILIQLPLPSHIDEKTVLDALDPCKDVDGLHPVNIGLLMTGRPRFIPATPSGIQQMLIRNGFDPEGKHVVVCGRSDIVGKPVSMLLMQRQHGGNATVTVCHSKTKGLAYIMRQADILIVAIGRPMFVTDDMVKDGAVVIDVGVNRVADSDRKNGYRLVGDVDFEAVSKKAAALSPVPGGVGPMTIAMLLKNTLKAARLSLESRASD